VNDVCVRSVKVMSPPTCTQLSSVSKTAVNSASETAAADAAGNKDVRGQSPVNTDAAAAAAHCRSDSSLSPCISSLFALLAKKEVMFSTITIVQLGLGK